MRTYPSSPLDDPAALRRLMGSFWSDAYADQAELDASLAAIAVPWRQAAIDLDELIASACYETIPPLHTREWTPIEVLEGSRGSAAYAGLRYDPGSGAVFGAAGRFGDARSAAGFPVPLRGIVEAPMIFDAPCRPSVALVSGIDYTIDRAAGAIILASDPFRDGLWAPSALYGPDGAQVDRRITLWAWRAKYDVRAVYRRIGYAMGVRAPSTEAGRDFVNGIVDAVTRGTSEYTVRRIFSALCDVPICREDREVVEAVFSDDRGLVVATDRSIHRYGPGARPLVVAGDVLSAGDCPVDALRFDPLNAGAVPADLPFLAVGPGLLPAGLGGSVAFFNRPVAVRAEDVDDADGAPLPCRVTWELGGDPGAAAAFWERAREGEAAAGVTLAELLDVRPSPADPPRAVNMPAEVNGLDFLLKNVLRGSAYLVRIRVAGCGPDRLDAAFMQALRRLVPPHVVLLVQVEMPPLAEGLAPGDSASSGSAEYIAATVTSPSPAPPASDYVRASAAPEYSP